MAFLILAGQRDVAAARRVVLQQQAAPLLCARLIGYRSLDMAGKAQRLGLYGFGAAILTMGAGG